MGYPIVMPSRDWSEGAHRQDPLVVGSAFPCSRDRRPAAAGRHTCHRPRPCSLSPGRRIPVLTPVQGPRMTRAGLILVSRKLNAAGMLHSDSVHEQSRVGQNTLLAPAIVYTAHRSGKADLCKSRLRRLPNSVSVTWCEQRGAGRACPHAVRPRSARAIQISKHAPMNPAIR
jgi:hypothetical protein